jgi:nucleotide-binding universal stress UspA family protein
MNSETLLIATDLNADPRRIMNAAGLLRAFHPRKLYLLHVLPREIPVVPLSGTGAAVLPPPVSSGPATNGADEAAAEEAVEKLAALAAALDTGADVEAELKHGHPATVICETAAALNVGLVVVASHGHGLMRRLFLGSTAQFVANNAPCNVLILRPEPATQTAISPDAAARADFAEDSALHPLPAAAGCVA